MPQVTVAFLYEALKRMRAVAMDSYEDDRAKTDEVRPIGDLELEGVETQRSSPGPAEGAEAAKSEGAEAAKGEGADGGKEAGAREDGGGDGRRAGLARLFRYGEGARAAAQVAPTSGGRVLWRGMRNLQVSKDFLSKGGTELAPMSTTADLKIAVRYSRGATAGVLIFMLNAETFMQATLIYTTCMHACAISPSLSTSLPVGADLTYCSAWCSCNALVTAL